jgi:transketolase
VPCYDQFFKQPPEYRTKVIGKSKTKVAVEAAIRMGWDAIIGDGPFIGMHSYGASGPYKELYEHFGITAEHVAKAALKHLNG